ncbi:MAG: D-tyrosyl-tRNA(Tyr) deacylase [Coprobacillus sp.]|nr:D-tyrosyl-tRNA(Tyr) deacylase [Coprobacillus sp.]
MRLVVQRVSEASVEIEGKINGQIKQGFMVLVGITNDDNEEIVDKMVNKLINLRIFEDENEKLNLSLMDIKGEILSISQFTLYANCKKGNRPSFINAGAPDMANEMYEYIIEKCREMVKVVETGEFGADMKVKLENDGPFTIVLDSDQL